MKPSYCINFFTTKIMNYRNVILLFKYVFSLICFIGFVYQINILLTDYLRGKTMVSVTIGRAGSQTLPAFTICTKDFLSVQKAVQFQPELSKLHNEYQELQKQLEDMKDDDQNRSRIVEQLENLYYTIEKRIDFTKLTVREMLYNISVEFRTPFMDFFVTGSGISFDQDNYTLIDDNEQLPRQPEQGIESIKLEWEQWTTFTARKCITLFSALDRAWRNFTMKVIRFDLFIQPNYEWMPPESYRGIYFSLHSPNSLPRIKEENFIYLYNKDLHEIFYTQINTELLGNGYDTNCHDYDLDYRYGNFNMKSDCVSDCYWKYVKVGCEMTEFPPGYELIRWDMLKYTTDLKLDQNFRCFWKVHDQINDKCQHICRPDCQFKYFTWDWRQRERTSDEQPSHTMRVIPSRLPTIQIKYLSQITFISFVCNFGGLLGMWLGLSFLRIFENLRKYFTKIIVNNIFSNNNFNLNVFNINYPGNSNTNLSVPKFGIRKQARLRAW